LREPGQPDPVEELVELFFKDAPALLEAIERGIAGRDMAGTIAAASSLKGSARNLGAKKFAEICAEIEQTARSGILAEAKPVLQQAQEEFCRVKTALELELKK
jgi:HPt (histidine-containing phosphotransfer) domain-containing protein